MPPQPAVPVNTLYYGDNFDILRDYIPAESIDLIYLDPPFNSQANYNVLFRDTSGKASEAQIQAFKDTWQWDNEAAKTYHYLTTQVGGEVGKMVGALHSFLDNSAMMAYLVMMAARLVELHRVLKPTGCLYLHCDPTASHYLKVVMDTIFGAENFTNEISWKRTTTKSDFRQGALNWPRIRDVLLHYRKDISAGGVFHQPFAAYSDEYVASKYRNQDADGRRYMLDNLTAPGAGSRGHPQYEFLGVTRYWRYNKDKMQQLYEEGRVVQPSPGAVPRYKRYLDEVRGIAIGDTWDDIDAINSMAQERLGYPTQKPQTLLERIIEASSNPGDIVLDPFCGCGTTIAASQKLGRYWIGVDITHLSILLLKNRLKDSFGLAAGTHYKVVGLPEDLGAAQQLAQDDRYQFQWWAMSLIPGCRPYGGVAGSKTGKKGADKGIDGLILFIDDQGGKPKQAIVQVKSGSVKRSDIATLKGDVEREGAAIGVFVTLEPPSGPMRQEAAAAGFYSSPGLAKDYPRIQILTVEELLKGSEVKMPQQALTTFKQAPKVGPVVNQGELDF